MSIASQITRLNQAKSSIKEALENKGVSVGNAKLDAYATLIDEMQVGGGTLPQLHAPNINYDIVTDIVTITDDAVNNGTYTTGYSIYSNGSKIADITKTATHNMSANRNSIAKDFAIITFKATNDNFIASANSNSFNLDNRDWQGMYHLGNNEYYDMQFYNISFSSKTNSILEVE